MKDYYASKPSIPQVFPLFPDYPPAITPVLGGMPYPVKLEGVLAPDYDPVGAKFEARKIDLEAQLAAAETRVSGLKAELHEHLKKTRIECGACGQKFEVGTVDYIQTHYYIAPYSCSGGDYWKQGEGQCDCPHCKVRLRFYNRPNIVALKYNFKSITEEYKDR